MWIFISHSTEKSDTGGVQRLKDLKDALTDAAGEPSGHDVLLDFDRLEPGWQWHAVLDEWLATCHAAILMLTPRALDSWWVLKEATILAHRAARDPQFILFPVLLDGLTGQQFKSTLGFSPLYLDALQRVGAASAAAIAAEVLRQLPTRGQEPRTPFDQLTTALTVQLKAGDGDQLEAISQSLTGQPLLWNRETTRAAESARIIASAIVRGSKGTYASLRDLIVALRNAGLTKEASARVLKLAAPLWVDSAAAAPLAEVSARNLKSELDAFGQPVSWSTAINGDYVPSFTAAMYLRRAYLPDTAQLRSLEGGESELRLEELIARLREEVRRSTPTLQGAKDAAIDAYLGGRSSPYFIVLPPPCPDEALLAALQARYAKVTFIAQADAATLTAGALPGRVVPLAPALDPARELAALDDYTSAADFIENS